MNRRGFLSALFGGAAAVALAPFAKIAAAAPAPALPEPKADTVGQDEVAVGDYRYSYVFYRDAEGAWRALRVTHPRLTDVALCLAVGCFVAMLALALACVFGWWP